MSQVGLGQGENPFPGLRPFGFEQHHLFFGRDEQVRELHQRLDRNRFLAVIGPSGSGKSSLIRAGLVPALHGDAGDGWRVAVFHPGDAPLKNLVESCCAACNAPERADESVASLRAGAGLAAVAESWGISAANRLLLIVDQFEEIFRFGRDTAEASFFVDTLLAASDQEDVPIFMVLTMRADFLGACTVFQGLPEAINNGQYLIPRMTPGEMRAAIEEPVRVADAAIAADLVERLLGDLGDNPDQLPVMQHALMRTWEHWEAGGGAGEIVGAHYEAVGTIRTALSQHAEEVYDSLPGAQSRRIAEVLFKCLTDKVDNTRGVRRPTPLHEVCAVADAEQGQVAEVVDCFRGSGRWFLTPGPETALEADAVLDLSHESLMRVWERLRGWVNEEAESAQQYLRLANTAALYQEGKAGLYQDPDLELALNWRERNIPTAAWAQRYDPTFERAATFLEHSRKERDFLVATREERKRRQLRRARLLASLAGVASIVFLLFLLYALELKFDADESKQEAIAQQQIAEENAAEAKRNAKRANAQKQIAEEQQLLARRNAEEAKENAAEANAQKQFAEEQQRKAVVARRNAEEQRQFAEEQQRQAKESAAAAIAQKQFAEEQRQTAVHERQRAERLLLLSIARSLAGEAAGIHERNEDPTLGGLLALQAYLFHRRNGGAELDSDIHNALRLSVEAGQPLRQRLWRGHEDEVRGLALQGGQALFSAGEDGRVFSWDLANGVRQAIFAGRQRLRAVEYHRASGRLAWGGSGGVWLSVGDSSRPQELKGESEETDFIVSALAFAGDGEALVAASLDGGLRVWHPERSQRPTAVRQVEGRILALAVRAGGDVLAWSDEGGRVALETFDGEELGGYRVRRGAVRALAFSRDGQRLAAGTGSGDILVWDLDKPEETKAAVFVGHTSAVTALEFDADGGLLASGSLDRSLRLWNATAPAAEAVLLPTDGWVRAVAFAADGARLYSAGADKNIRVWEVGTHRLAVGVCDGVDRDLSPQEWERYIGADIPYENTCNGVSALPHREIEP